MAQDPTQIIRLIQQLMRATRGRLGVRGLIGLVIAVVLYAAVIQPLAEKHWGLTLPTLGGDPPVANAPADPPPRRPQTPPQQERPAAPSVADAGDLTDVLTEEGRGSYRSAGGLRYTRGSQHGTRLAHLLAHTRDDPDRVGQHGVFDDDDPATVVRLVDEAYAQALSGRNTRTQREDDRTVYTVDLGRRIGYIGGQSGNRRNKPRAEHLKLVVEGDRFITAFPFRP
ncbi:hypothetical protein MalM25_11840 [Planctomycetes bacterium MalM25]|nr:hypothetical protein MalM25_11840 [Planctomycetes bacterium MalM25]